MVNIFDRLLSVINESKWTLIKKIGLNKIFKWFETSFDDWNDNNLGMEEKYDLLKCATEKLIVK